jgi:hypothetical protein
MLSDIFEVKDVQFNADYSTTKPDSPSLLLFMRRLLRVCLIAQIQALYFFSGPWSPSQKDKAGLDAGVFCKTVYPDLARHLFPPVFFNQVRENHFEGHAMKRVFVLIIDHD